MSITRSRGYAFERYVVERFLKKGYFSFRLGGTTQTMPDVHAIVCNKVYGIECKSTQGNVVKFPAEQILRCFDWVNHLPLYEPTVILACKFKGNSSRKLKYSYYQAKLIDGMNDSKKVTNPKGYITVSYMGIVNKRLMGMNCIMDKVELIL